MGKELAPVDLEHEDVALNNDSVSSRPIHGLDIHVSAGPWVKKSNRPKS